MTEIYTGKVVFQAKYTMEARRDRLQAVGDDASEK
jgi:hypothetical protein